jgi:enoyl-CoA hydratase/carnithine racemase
MDAMTEPPRDPEGRITSEVRGSLLLVGFDRVEKLNGFTPKMFDELADVLTQLDEDPALRVGVLFGHGPHTTAGLDLPKWSRRLAGEGDNTPGARGTRRVDPVALGRSCRKPIVTAVQGITFTLGIELMLAGDIVVAADDCRFNQLEPRRGIMASGGATMRFVERGGWGNGMYHLLINDEFDASEAQRCGLVQEIVPAGRQLERAIELAEKIAELAPLAIQATKESARIFATEGQEACVDAIAPAQARLSRTEDAKEGVASFREKRPPVFQGR